VHKRDPKLFVSLKIDFTRPSFIQHSESKHILLMLRAVIADVVVAEVLVQSDNLSVFVTINHLVGSFGLLAMND
jgi:hypothetical protein